MRTTLQGLSEYLFAELDALTNEDLNGEDLEKEIKRAQAVSSISMQVINTAQVQLKAVELCAEYDSTRGVKLPALIAGGDDEVL